MNYKTSAVLSQKDLNTINQTKTHITTKAKYGPSKETKIPLIIKPELAFIVATIIGDGHLRKEKKQICIELTDLDLLKQIQDYFKIIFKREFNINLIKLRKGRKQSWQMPIDSKAIHNLLNQTFEIPIGKKSHIVKIPEFIKNSNKSVKKAFLQGIMLTEGGKRRRGYGLSTASKTLWKDLSVLFEEFEIPIQLDRWIYKKYKKEYYGLVFKEKHYLSLMRECRSGQTS
ncbi:hypothetical protein CMI41_01785 [Candidatus Pacearchaeota archaeon]|nr:hypothetical protein [Candidatus Pacearchaeota archaeon]|tara:strand:- start:12914 stop:13600 length:687 start_codon:yes stop_codon:yes gene_type:complete